jgi:uncharacterized BrkB/YihY/UPF0761 family membrane protein
MVARSLVAGALVSVGLGAVLSPALLYVLIVAALFALIDRAFGLTASTFELVFALVPWLIGVAAWSLAGGYVAGAMTERDRARHGAAAALAGLVVMLVLGLVLGVVSPSLLGLTVALGALAAVPVAMLFGRLGAMAAPRGAVVVAPAEDRVVARAPVARPQPRLLPAAGLKGGEKVDDDSV